MRKEFWIFSEINRQTLFSWCDHWQLPPMETRFLLTRGLKKDSQVEEFFSDSSSGLSEPLKWDHMEKAAKRILDALNKKEKICIYGDYDVDGITGVAILVEAMNRLGHLVDFYIPDRQEEGYGLNGEALQKLYDQGVSLVITVDCGTSSADLITEFQAKGLDIIVTDHHLPGEKLPTPFSLINPQCAKDFLVDPLAGAGVAFKLAQGIFLATNESLDKINDLIGWAALATIADMVPLQGENRLIVKLGLDELRKSTNIGLQALIEVAGLKQKEITERDLGFSIGPRLNASGRLQTAKLGVALFLCKDKSRSLEIASELDEVNRERQQVEKEILAEARKKIEQFKKMPVGIVLHDPGWHPGVVGIVASRLAKEFWRPTLLLCGSGEVKGSGRSIPGVDLHKALSNCKSYLDKFGGHRQAAGVSLKEENIEYLRAAFCQAVESQIQPEDLIPRRSFDGMLTLSEMTTGLLDRIGELSPFGIGNQGPRFLFPYGEIDSIRALGAEKQHLKIGIREGNQCKEAMIWQRGSELNNLTKGNIIHGIGEIRRNSWNGQESIEMIWDQFSLELESLLKKEELLIEKPEGSSERVFSTDRESFAKFYQLLHRMGKDAPILSVEWIGLSWKKEIDSSGWSEVDYFLRVFEELGLIQKVSEELIAFENNNGTRTSLEKSKIYQEELEKAGK